MCDMVIPAIAMTAASTAMSIGGQIYQQSEQAKATRTAASRNAQIAENDAAMRNKLAQNERAKGDVERTQQQRAALRDMGTMRAEMGASGFEMDSGTNLSLLQESATEHQHDSNIIMQNADMSAWEHEAGAINSLNDKSFAQWQKRNANAGMTGALLGAGGTLLGGIGTGIDRYNTWQKSSPAKGTTANVTSKPSK